MTSEKTEARIKSLYDLYNIRFDSVVWDSLAEEPVHMESLAAAILDEDKEEFWNLLGPKAREQLIRDAVVWDSLAEEPVHMESLAAAILDEGD